MIITTTNNIEGKRITEYKGLVVGETILGANFFKDILAGLTDIFGGRSSAYESSLQEAREIAMQEMTQKAQQMGANAILGLDLDYETIGRESSNLLMVTCSGTAVRVE